MKQETRNINALVLGSTLFVFLLLPGLCLPPLFALIVGMGGEGELSSQLWTLGLPFGGYVFQSRLRKTTGDDNRPVHRGRQTERQTDREVETDTEIHCRKAIGSPSNMTLVRFW